MLRSSTVALLASSLLFGCADADHSGFFSQPVSLPLIPAFETRIDMSTGADRHVDMVLADFTGDAVLDMVVVNLSGEVELLVGQGNGTFAAIAIANPGGSPVAVASADLDGDPRRRP